MHISHSLDASLPLPPPPSTLKPKLQEGTLSSKSRDQGSEGLKSFQQVLPSLENRPSSSLKLPSILVNKKERRERELSLETVKTPRTAEDIYVSLDSKKWSLAPLSETKKVLSHPGKIRPTRDRTTRQSFYNEGPSLSSKENQPNQAAAFGSLPPI